MDISAQIAALVAGLDLSDSQVAALKNNYEALFGVDKEPNGFLLTRQGFDVLGKALAGKELKFSRVAFGDSQPSDSIISPSDDDIFDLVDLIHWQKDLPLINIQNTGTGEAALTFLVKNEDVTEGFFIREMGIFALDPDTEDEILYCYCNAGLKATFLPAGGGAEIWEQRMIVAVVVAQAQHVTAIIDASLLYLSLEEFNRHILSTNPHPNIPHIAEAVDSTHYIWAGGEDNNLHPISLSDFISNAFGTDSKALLSLNSRVSQTEVNIANLFMQLNAERDIGLAPNLLLVEDFDNPVYVDDYEQPVITSAAGINNVRVVSNDAIRTGCWYTISDGVHNEFVQVSALAKNGQAHVVVFTDKILNTYDLTNTKLYRTTSAIESGQASGANPARTFTQAFDTVWKGTSSSSNNTAYLNTTLANTNNLTLSGNYGFTSDGEFTLN